MVKIAGVVTLYNPEKSVKKNILSYIDSIDRLYVIDNSNGNNNIILPDDKKIVYLPNYENLGVATALNIAAREAIKDNYDWILTMDQDSEFNKNDVKKLTNYIEKKEFSNVGIVTPWHRTNNLAEKPKEDIDYPFEVMTSGNLVNLTAYQKVGGFKDNLFIDGVDIEYCMNLQRNNYKIIRLNYIELKHELGDTKIKKLLWKKVACSNHNYIRRYYMARNTFYICSIYNDIFPDYCKVLKRGLFGQFKNILVFEKDKYRKIRNMYRGYKDYKKGINGKYNYNN